MTKFYMTGLMLQRNKQKKPPPPKKGFAKPTNALNSTNKRLSVFYTSRFLSYAENIRLKEE
jgi:hypothetical protein